MGRQLGFSFWREMAFGIITASAILLLIMMVAVYCSG